MALNDFLRNIPDHLERMWATATKKNNVVGCLVEKYKKDMPYVIYVNGIEKYRVAEKRLAYKEYNDLVAADAIL